MDVGKCKTRENMAIRAVVTKCFRNFARILSFSLYKGSWGIEEKLGYELATVLNSTFCYEMHQRTPDDVPPAVLWLIIGCKGT